MKVFISWSGERSRQVAELLTEWIQCVLQAVDPWLSTKDIDKGSLWFSEITNQLSNTQHGIICLTKTNLNNPWILFEAGALAKGLSSSRVYTFLVDLEPNDVKDPLAQFNHTKPSRESVFQLARSINKGLNESALRENIFVNVFETYWPQFEHKFTNILRETGEEEVKLERPKEDILNEILASVRVMDKRLRRVEDFESKSSDNYTTHGFQSKSKNDILYSEIGEKPIEELDLSVRLFNTLKSKNVTSVKEISKLDSSSLSPALREELLKVIAKLFLIE